jgi:hypothetical protein
MKTEYKRIGYVWEDYDTSGDLIGVYFFKTKPKNLYLKEVYKNIKPVYKRKGIDEKINSNNPTE